MRIIDSRDMVKVAERNDAEWAELAGPFRDWDAAVAWSSEPPESARMERTTGVVTLVVRSHGVYVLLLEAARDVEYVAA